MAFFFVLLAGVGWSIHAFFPTLVEIPGYYLPLVGAVAAGLRYGLRWTIIRSLGYRPHLNVRFIGLDKTKGGHPLTNRFTFRVDAYAQWVDRHHRALISLLPVSVINLVGLAMVLGGGQSVAGIGVIVIAVNTLLWAAWLEVYQAVKAIAVPRGSVLYRRNHQSQGGYYAEPSRAP